LNEELKKQRKFFEKSLKDLEQRVSKDERQRAEHKYELYEVQIADMKKTIETLNTECDELDSNFRQSQKDYLELQTSSNLEIRKLND